MGYMTNGLSFRTLRAANEQRLPQFKDAKGRQAHSQSDGSDWSPADWMTASVGELGELANIMKKVRRGDLTIDEARPEMAKELADVVTYLDILAKQLDIDLGEAVREKFNEVSRRVGAAVFIGHDDDWHMYDRL
jgi:NTP pyrophosphatase (non-canonical NTP hydrolase)